MDVFKDHELVRTAGDNRWTIKRPGTSQFWAEIAILSAGTVVVHGDIEPAIFAHYSGNDNTAEGCLRWVAGMADSLDYGREKMSIGMGKNLGVEYLPKKAERDIELLAERYKDRGETYEALMELADVAPYKDRHEVYEEIYAITGGAEDCQGIGEVPSSRLLYAIGAVKRLVEILYGQDNKEEA